MWIAADYLSRSGKIKERNDCFGKYTQSELNNTQSQHVQKKTIVALIEISKCAFGPSLFVVWITHYSFNNALLMWDIELIRLLETPRSLKWVYTNLASIELQTCSEVLWLRKLGCKDWNMCYSLLLWREKFFWEATGYFNKLY